MSCGPDKELYQTLFGDKPKRAAKGAIVNLPIDFAELNVIMPHPIYAWMYWVCVNSPESDTLDDFHKLIHSSYEKAKRNYYAKMKKDSSESHR